MRLRDAGLSVLLGVATVLAAERAAADPRSDFFCRMLSDGDTRVRVSAALRLAALHTPDSVEPLLAAFGREHEPAARAAMLSAIAAIADPRASEAVTLATHDPSPAVRAQAVRAAAAIRAADTRSEPSTTASAPRFRVGVGDFASAHEIRAAVPSLARRSLTEALGAHPEVVVADGSAPRPEARLHGYFIDGSVRSSTTPEGDLRVDVSLVVQTDPGREFRFESLGSATVRAGSIPPGPTGHDTAEDLAIRHAVTSATERTFNQLAGTR